MAEELERMKLETEQEKAEIQVHHPQPKYCLLNNFVFL
jgi:hypothetical protein